MKTSKEFNNIIKDLLDNPYVNNMDTMKQHLGKVNLLEHLIYTAYITYKICDKFNLNIKSATKAALLHDFRLSEQSGLKNAFSHSKASAKEAAYYFKLSKLESSIIESHMWPLNITLLPKSKEAMVVSIADKYCATMEILHLFRKPKVITKLKTLSQSNI